jgi:branched-subunit amino acid aminotransferase/4-amino-4-deoxychorismate lyase
MEREGAPTLLDDITALALCNYGHFTSMLVDKMRVRGLPLHLARLVRDSEQLFGGAIDPQRVPGVIADTLLGRPEPTVVRVTVFAPDFDMNYPGRNSAPTVLVTSRPAPSQALPPLRVRSVHYQRDLPTVKHIGLFSPLQQRRRAQLDGFDDALFLDKGSAISEGPTWNVGFFRAGQVIWPKSDYLPGVTMHLVEDAVKKNGIKSKTTPISITGLSEMDAAFATNAVSGVRSISAIDDHLFPADSDLLTDLRELYLATPWNTLTPWEHIDAVGTH